MYSQNQIYAVIFILNSSPEMFQIIILHHIESMYIISVQGILGINEDKKVITFSIILFL
jgi:hypothetical protein